MTTHTTTPPPQDAQDAQDTLEIRQRTSTLWTFWGLLERDLTVMRREFGVVVARSAVQPLLFCIVFGWILPQMGTVSTTLGSYLVPGILAMSTMLSGMQAIMLPISIDLGFQREIDDRILCPIRVEWIAVEKILFGAAEALIAAVIVLPLALLIIPDADVDVSRFGLLIPMLVVASLLSASFGMFVGTLVQARQLVLVMSVVVTPLIFFGCTYYPWQQLGEVSKVLQYAVLVNPLVYVSEGLRAVLTPQVPHMPAWGIVVGTLVSITVIGFLGVRRFVQRALE